ncbi:MAG: GNAT family N-acetyltransferase [Cruoricaptor ignavus]|nr:GNAT family N-acetyltransferase [Cruoricaptor ignavus]
MEKLVIREINKNDSEKLLNLLKLNVPKYFADSEIQDFENYLKDEIEYYFIVEIDDKIIGSGGINLEKENKIAKISWDIIAPEYQGKGIGKQLLNHRINFIKNHFPTFKIIVRTSQIVYKFYWKNGFKLIEKHKDYWTKGFDMYKMEYDEK